MPVPALVRAACALDLALAAAVAVALPVFYGGWLATAIAAGLAATLASIAYEIKRGRFEGWLFQLFVLLLLPLRAVWAFRPFGAALAGALLYLWIDPDVLAWFRMRDAASGRRPPAPVAVALIVAAMEVVWIAVLPDRLFTGYREGLLAPLLLDGAPKPFGAFVMATAFASLAGFKLAWYALPAALTPVLMGVHPVAWALALAPVWLAAPVRAWHGLSPRPSALAALIALAPPFVGLAAHLGMPIGLCERDGWPITLVKWRDAPLTVTADNLIDEDAPDLDRMKIHCALEEVFVANRAYKDACVLARGACGKTPPAACPLDRRMRAALGARGVPPHRFEPDARPNRPPFACTTCDLYDRKEAPAP